MVRINFIQALNINNGWSMNVALHTNQGIITRTDSIASVTYYISSLVEKDLRVISLFKICLECFSDFLSIGFICCCSIIISLHTRSIDYVWEIFNINIHCSSKAAPSCFEPSKGTLDGYSSL